MIHICWDKKHGRVTVRGHAEDGQYGSNAICAATSILTYTLAEGLEKLARQEKLSCTVVLEDGYARLQCRESTPGARRLFATVCRGYRLLANTCPNQVEMEIINA